MARSVAEFREENQKKNLGRIENLERRLKAESSDGIFRNQDRG